jgi:hypothetical protein
MPACERTLKLDPEAPPAGADPRSPLVRFYQMIPGTPHPGRADETAGGTMPARAHRLCEAMRSASAFGWYLYPPISFTVMWDGGSDIFWTYEGADAWHPVHTVHFPGFPEEFNRAAPVDVRPFVPPFLTALRDPGILQVWTGVMARTACGWSLLVRSPANLARSKAYDFLEGMIRADSWFGPLFTTIRLTRTNAPIEFRVEHPLLQVQPVHRAWCYDQLERYQIVADLKRLTTDDWAAFRKTVVQPNGSSRSSSRRNGSARTAAEAIAAFSAYSSAALGVRARMPRVEKKGIDAPAATTKRTPTAPSP